MKCHVRIFYILNTILLYLSKYDRIAGEYDGNWRKKFVFCARVPKNSSYKIRLWSIPSII